MPKLTIWTNHRFSPEQEERLRRAAQAHELVYRPGASSAPELRDADVAFGQPPLSDVLESQRLRWVQLSSAGYGSYEGSEIRRAFAAAGRTLTKSSAVYASPCAQHVLAFMLAWARRLPDAMVEQQGKRGWPQTELRQRSMLLEGQRVLMVGFGSIGERLAELLEPFSMQLVGVRRSPKGGERVQTIALDDARLAQVFAEADHVVNLLPGVPATHGFFDAARFAGMRRGAVFYNVGRGSTVDQAALAAALRSGQLQAALLDVTDPEPLPPEHELWSTPGCHITPHSAGGHHDEGDRLTEHFLQNLRRFERGEPVTDRAY